VVIDTSALTAILRGEPEREAFLRAITTAPERMVSCVTKLEALMVMEGRYGPDAAADLELFLHAAGVEIVAFDRAQSEWAGLAWRKYGKGRHPAALNLGDCCVYGLARASGQPVLCKGNDFALTDLAVVKG